MSELSLMFYLSLRGAKRQEKNRGFLGVREEEEIQKDGILAAEIFDVEHQGSA